ncbi:helix-turn-helix transcriptional regulator [Chitinimonas viridis]|uniref:Helix-turn-helix transcriptional regulator n=1 Tax=Chitinimonas viridis TaxID=664880 RepID=A0ABT8B0C8_9NEIS|nr:helix-turn-helix transcriptional regulator [Chitinimonas viridis]MDN3575693.1 helix-turn-helix transcriptional regulator [Chitinimonas viridis]
MSPFADHLFQLRRSRGLRQKDLANLLGIGTSYLCALETGRKEPPSEQQLARMAKAMALDQSEYAAFVEVANLSRRNLEIPIDASVDEYQIAHALIRRMGELTCEQVAAISMILKIDAKRLPVQLYRETA